jgi:4Fe-4S ferredoxin
MSATTKASLLETSQALPLRKRSFSPGSTADFKHPAGKLMPVIDAQRCEGAGPCIAVCPVNVFTLRAPNTQERAALGWKARVKVWVHGGKQAFVTDADACRACGLCVSACPERAIQLARNPSSQH